MTDTPEVVGPEHAECWSCGALIGRDKDTADDLVRQLVAAAYEAGATDVHNSWVEGTNSSEPDFYEAASDYARAARPGGGSYQHAAWDHRNSQSKRAGTRINRGGGYGV